MSFASKDLSQTFLFQQQIKKVFYLNEKNQIELVYKHPRKQFQCLK